jgi:hypothetical protein
MAPRSAYGPHGNLIEFDMGDPRYFMNVIEKYGAGSTRELVHTYTFNMESEFEHDGKVAYHHIQKHNYDPNGYQIPSYHYYPFFKIEGPYDASLKKTIASRNRTAWTVLYGDRASETEAPVNWLSVYDGQTLSSSVTLRLAQSGGFGGGGGGGGF